MGTTAAIAAPLLPALEPVLGISVALNLAYLNIPKFRYISIVADRLTERLDQLPPAAKGSVKHTPWFRQLDDLSKVDARELEPVYPLDPRSELCH